MRPARLCPYPSTFLRSPLRRDILHKAIVYEANAARGTGGHTKTRGEVRGSTRKIRQQKGTGMARVGARVAPGRRGGILPNFKFVVVLICQVGLYLDLVDGHLRLNYRKEYMHLHIERQFLIVFLNHNYF